MRKRATWKNSIGFFIFFTTLSLCSCSFHTQGYDDAYPVKVKYEDFKDYYSQLERRMDAWTQKLGLERVQLPDVADSYKQVDFFEFTSTPKSTCYFEHPRSVYIGNDKWNSGCVPHEIGHAALFMIHHPQWCNFEHKPDTWHLCGG